MGLRFLLLFIPSLAEAGQLGRKRCWHARPAAHLDGQLQRHCGLGHCQVPLTVTISAWRETGGICVRFQKKKHRPSDGKQNIPRDSGQSGSWTHPLWSARRKMAQRSSGGSWDLSSMRLTARPEARVVECLGSRANVWQKRAHSAGSTAKRMSSSSGVSSSSSPSSPWPSSSSDDDDDRSSRALSSSAAPRTWYALLPRRPPSHARSSSSATPSAINCKKWRGDGEGGLRVG